MTENVIVQFNKAYLMKRPDRVDPVVDLIGFGGPVSDPFFEQRCRQAFLVVQAEQHAPARSNTITQQARTGIDPWPDESVECLCAERADVRVNGR